MAIKIEDYKKALKAANGLFSVAAKTLGVTPQAVAKRIKTNKPLKEYVEALLERELDFVESKLMTQINNDNLTAIIFYLKCKGKKRGYVEKETELIIDNSKTVFVAPEMSTEESWKKLPKK